MTSAWFVTTEHRLQAVATSLDFSDTVISSVRDLSGGCKSFCVGISVMSCHEIAILSVCVLKVPRRFHPKAYFKSVLKGSKSRVRICQN